MQDKTQLDSAAAYDLITIIEKEIGKVIIGQQLMIRRLLTGLFAAIPYSITDGIVKTGCGHVLLEGVPGVAKTLTATTLAKTISADFQRIQLTPDMLPGDIIGTRIYEMNTASFRIDKGPVFTNVLLADEINRATSKTQSALLEAMQERQVTLADTTFELADPFWVLATQNPVEQEGVYTLPEAQLDRFSMMLRVDYPGANEEIEMLHHRFEKLDLAKRLTTDQVTDIRNMIYEDIHVDDKILEYIVRLGRATRAPETVGLTQIKEMVLLGMSPRSYQHVLALSRVNAFLNGRDHILPGDVKEIFPDAARHRISRTVRAEVEGIESDNIINSIINNVAIP
ncbi:MAG: AAA family ATPase [Gammaproteobacteria bacterium]|jgi:MoxR-like ATPase